jgi:hypothetical protein
VFVSYLESYLNELQLWFTEWRIDINISKPAQKYSRVPDGASSTLDH